MKNKERVLRQRKAFTLVEVMLALAIFLVVVLALMRNYYAYINFAQQNIYKNTAQNIAKMELEDTRNLSVTIVDSLLKGGQYPPATIVEGGNLPIDSGWLRFKHSDTYVGCYEVASNFSEISEDIPNGIPFPKDIDPSDTVYDSGIVDASYRIENIQEVFGIENSPSLNISMMEDPTSMSNLPNHTVIVPVYHSAVDFFDYTILLYNNSYPFYKRRIVITDITPFVTQVSQKVYNIKVEVYWTVGGHIDPSTSEIIGGETTSLTLEENKSFPW